MYIPISFLSLSSIDTVKDNLIIAVNQGYIKLEEQQILKEGDEIAVIPPISGG